MCFSVFQFTLEIVIETRRFTFYGILRECRGSRHRSSIKVLLVLGGFGQIRPENSAVISLQVLMAALLQRPATSSHVFTLLGVSMDTEVSTSMGVS